MSIDLFNISWFIVFITVIFIAFMANTIVILAILRDKSMHTSTYFYIINVAIADIILVLCSLPERITALFRPNDGFPLGVTACYMVPFLQQVSMHAALGFLLILTVHRCYPAGVPRCLQGSFIRQQIHNHSQTLCLVWIFATLINLPLFSITKYTPSYSIIVENQTNSSRTKSTPTCETEATETWSRTYLSLLLVLTYVITGVFLIVIYGQVIRIIIVSNRYAKRLSREKRRSRGHYHFLSPNVIHQEKFREILKRTSTSSSTSSRLQQQNTSNTLPMSMILPTGKNTYSTSSRSIQHIQLIIMLFIVILLYIVLLLPYRLLNLLYIVYNPLFQHDFLNDILFHCLLNIVRLLVFLNCALQPILYLVISSRLRQTTIKFLRSCWYKYYCQCHWSLSCNTNDRATEAYLSQKYHNTNGNKKQSINPNHPRAANKIHRNEYQSLTLMRPPLNASNQSNKTPYTVTFTNPIRKC